LPSTVAQRVKSSGTRTLKGETALPI